MSKRLTLLCRQHVVGFVRVAGCMRLFEAPTLASRQPTSPPTLVRAYRRCRVLRLSMLAGLVSRASQGELSLERLARRWLARTMFAGALLRSRHGSRRAGSRASCFLDSPRLTFRLIEQVLWTHTRNNTRKSAQSLGSPLTTNDTSQETYAMFR